MIHRLTVAKYNPIYRPVKFDIQAQKGPIWLRPRLTKFVWWLLRKLEAYPEAQIRHDEIKYVNIKSDKIIESLQLSRQSLQRIWQGDCQLFIGPDAYQGLMKELDSPLGIYAHVDLNDGYEHKVCGVPITYVPWMEGVLLAPLVKFTKETFHVTS